MINPIINDKAYRFPALVGTIVQLLKNMVLMTALWLHHFQTDLPEIRAMAILLEEKQENQTCHPDISV